jgi:hypothetical protein
MVRRLKLAILRRAVPSHLIMKKEFMGAQVKASQGVNR